MHALDQEAACLARFILGAVEGAKPYYWEMPDSFNVPAVFFPTPEIVSAGDALNSYELAFTWLVKFFHRTDGEAQNLAQTALVAIQKAHRLIPLYTEDGADMETDFRVLDPSIRQVSRGAWQMTVRWNSPRYYSEDEVDQAAQLFMSGIGGTLYGND